MGNHAKSDLIPTTKKLVKRKPANIDKSDTKKDGKTESEPEESQSCPFCLQNFENESLRDKHLKACRPDWAIEAPTKEPIKEEDINVGERSPDLSELEEMQRKYPYLFEWKKRGLKNFFRFPIVQLVETMGKNGFNKVEEGSLNSDQVRKVIDYIMTKIDRKIKIIDGIEELPKHIQKDLNTRCNPVGISIPKSGDIYLVAGNLYNINSILEVLRRMGIEPKGLTNVDINNSLSSSLKKDSEVRRPPQIETIDANTERNWIAYIQEAQVRIVAKGENRGEVGRDLIKKFLPKTNGGPGFTKNQAIIIKYIHRELQKLIKDVRYKLEIPLKKSSDFYRETWDVEKKGINSEYIKECCPEIFHFLDEKEISILIIEPSIAKSSLKIITKRLSKSLHINQRITSTSLKNILSKTPLS